MAANTRSSNVRFHLLEKCSLELAVLIYYGQFKCAFST